MAVIHISEHELASALPDVLEKARAGDEVRIGHGRSAMALVPMTAGEPRRKTLSEAIRLAELRKDNVTLDDKFGSDLADILRNHDRSGNSSAQPHSRTAMTS